MVDPTEIHHISSSRIAAKAAGQHVMLNHLSVMWHEYCAPSGGQSDTTETAQLVPQDAFPQHYWEERWQALKWHKLSACIVLNQSSRRALRKSAPHSPQQWRHTSQPSEQSPPILHLVVRILRERLQHSIKSQFHLLHLYIKAYVSHY